MPIKLEWNDLNSIEKVSALSFISEAKDLWITSKLKGLSFSDWLDQLSEGIKTAIEESNRNKK
jgi:hypothetical protein